MTHLSSLLRFGLFFGGFAKLVLAEPSAQLLLPSRTLDATSTFEMRFATPMIAKEQVGSSAKESPLVVQPQIEGVFTWLSTRSGSFAPKNALPLGTKFNFSIRPGLTDATGNAVPATLREQAQTATMRVKGVNELTERNPEDAPVLPKLLVLFNANVDPASAAKFCHFVNASGGRVEARVLARREDGKTFRFPAYFSDDKTLAIWGESPPPQGSGEEEEGDESAAAADEKAAPRKNILFIAPAKPLPVGKGWKLVIDAGLPAAEWKVQLAARKEIEIGDVQPFVVKSISAESARNAGRRVVVTFSKPVAEEVTSEKIGDWIAVVPQPANSEASAEGNTVSIKADFALGVKYRVAVKAGIPANEQLKLVRPANKEVSFPKIDARLVFEDFAVHQSATGTRRFRLLSLNVPRVRVTARLFNGNDIVAGRKAYDHYEDRPDDAPQDEMYSRVSAEELPGEVIWQRDFSPAGRGNDDVQETIPLSWDEILRDRKTGAVLLTAESTDPVTRGRKRVGTQAFVQLTDIAAMWKQDRGNTTLHLFSLSNGQPIGGAKVRLFDSKEEELAATSSDREGNAKLEASDRARWFFVETRNDAHLVELNGAGDIPTYRLGISENVGDSDSENSVFVFTERGVYKPGDTLYVKGFARDPEITRSRVPAGKQVKLVVTDAKEQEVLKKQVTLSDYGSFNEEVTLPAAPLGKYRIAVEGQKDDQLSGSSSFYVEQYRPNEFEVSIAEPPAVSGSGPVDFAVTAKYFMGKPVTHAKLTWSITARDAELGLRGFDDWAFCDGLTDYRLKKALDRVSQYNAQGTTAIASDGSAHVATDLPVNPRAPQPRAVKFVSEVTDLNQQTVSESRTFVRQASEFYFGLKRFDAVLRQGDKLPVELIAITPDGKPLDQSVNATLRLTKIKWQTNRFAAAGDTTEFQSKPLFERIGEQQVPTKPGLADTRKPNLAIFDGFTAGTPGEYLLEASGKDSQGHDVVTCLSFEVSGKAEVDWNYRNPYVIDVVSDKDSYETGETAKLLVKTPISGDAIVTVERDRVLRTFMVKLDGNAPSVQVPIDENYAPNVYVSVVVVRGGANSQRKLKMPEYRIGYSQFTVRRRTDKLDVAVKATAPSYRPGDKVAVDVELKDSAGKTTGDAEVVLYAVDEGVLSLTGYKTPDPLAFFAQPRRLGVRTALTLPTLLKEDMAEADFANKGYLIGDGKGGANIEQLRKNFIACAFWNATLHTDAAGRVHAEFAAPDSLTRYRVIAVAATKQSQFGAGEGAFEVNKPLMIEAAMPKFGSLGDKLVARGVLHNATNAAGEAIVELKLDETGKATGLTRKVQLAAHASVAVDFPIELAKAGTGKWVWRATFTSADQKTQLNDAMQAEIKVNYPVPPVREVDSKRVENDRGELYRIGDPQIAEGTGEVNVMLSNTRVLELHEATRNLLHYPYGCVEQTTSSMLPWLLLRDLKDALPELQRSEAEVAAAVKHGVDLLLSMQTPGGGLSYWPDGKQPMLWGSAYGALGLTTAKRQGFKVPEPEYKKLLGYISQQLRGTGKDLTGYALSDRCLAVYSLALAGQPEPAYHELLFGKRAKLSAEDRALLALAIVEAKGPRQMVDQLLAGPAVDEAYVEQWFGSLARENALHLLAWTTLDAKARRVDELATELFSRRANGHWGTTQSNAWSLLALASYLRNVEAGSPDAHGEVNWAGQRYPFSLTKQNRLTSSKFPITAATAQEPVTIEKTGRVFAETTAEARPKLVEQPRQNRGYTIARRYAKVNDDGKIAPAEQLQVGDRILVTLDIDVPRRATYVAIEDALPGVFAPINPAFKTQEVAAGEQLGTEWVSDYHELRDDRALFFADALFPGRYTLRYLARVVSAGEAIAPAAKIEEMYHPERFGMTETQRVSARPLP